MQGIKIIATGRALPQKQVTNDDLSRLVDTNDEWIRTRTGIRQRYFCEEETCQSLAIEAAGKAVEKAGIDKAKIGLADGRQLAAAFALGAVGVQVGTCLLAAEECPIHPAYKQAVIDSGDNGTTVTGRIAGTPVRILKNAMVREYVKHEKAGMDKMELEKFTLGALKKAVFEGDTKTGSLMAGQVSAQLKEIKPVAEILENLMLGYEEVLKNLR